ncbi:peptide methionine sulfoxide reductase A1-like [Olea europaea subsp. europaea]|uniref:Peptide methionine sulfoxide reductase n=1 Tax=Olea europaea subsp. europaea TaxID=158383 RepID=A0A8S0R3K8_OLEEU|nr:peptide methionine sulfoxide reductase A1-like [Olea europaea subsp. europaea]
MILNTPPLPRSPSFLRSFSFPKFYSPTPFNSSYTVKNPSINSTSPRMSWLYKFRFGVRNSTDSPVDSSSDSSIAQGPDDEEPAPGQQFAQLGAGCFWGVELAFQRVPGVTKTEVGYSQGYLHNPTYQNVCSGTTNHSEVVRVQYDPKDCSYETLLDVFWARNDPTTPNRQGNDVGTQYRSGIYYYTPEQEKAALESRDKQQELLNRKIVTEILPAKKFYRAEQYHQQYLEKGGRFGLKQSAGKGCNDPIRCYG